MTLIHPTVHLNGTSQRELLQGYVDAIRALREAERAMAQAAPNARDYYVKGPDVVREAMRQHADRMVKLAEVISDLEAIAEKLADDE